jgi:hypothetical protein
LPVAVFGNSSTNSTQRGYLNGTSRSFTYALISCASASVARDGSFSTTKAFGLSSPSASREPTTAASSTIGCDATADSTSKGETYCPLTFIMSSERPA